MHQKVKPGHFSATCLLPQGKDDFERQQKELLDKENIIKQSQVQLGQEQVRLSLSLHDSILSVINIYLFIPYLTYTQLLTFWVSWVQRVCKTNVRPEGIEHLEAFFAARWLLRAIENNSTERLALKTRFLHQILIMSIAVLNEHSFLPKLEQFGVFQERNLSVLSSHWFQAQHLSTFNSECNDNCGFVCLCLPDYYFLD